MKRIMSLIVALICMVVFPAALAEVYLDSPALENLTWLDGETFEEGFYESYMTDDGLITVEVITVEATEYGMVGESDFVELMAVRVGGEMGNLEYIDCEGVGSYPAQRIRFETSMNEDSSVVDATAIWTDSKTFVYIVTASADAWYGYMDVYAEGEIPAMVDAWVSELVVDEFVQSEDVVEETEYDDAETGDAASELSLQSPSLTRMTYLEGDVYDEGSFESYMTDDGLIVVEVLTIESSEHGMVGEGTFEELMELRAEGSMINIESIDCEGVASYPAQRIRFESGANEDSSVVDATAIWTDSKTFVYIVTASADAWYGYMDVYAEGEVPTMVDAWIAELMIVED